MRYLAIDYGNKRTGLAICDQAETLASPLAVITGQKQLLQKIDEIIEKENVEAVVIGLPLNMDGTQSTQTKFVLKFAENLKNHLNIPVNLHDERLSSFGARQKLIPADYTRKKRKKRLDAVAAADILESFLEQKNTK